MSNLVNLSQTTPQPIPIHMPVPLRSQPHESSSFTSPLLSSSFTSPLLSSSFTSPLLSSLSTRATPALSTTSTRALSSSPLSTAANTSSSVFQQPRVPLSRSSQEVHSAASPLLSSLSPRARSSLPVSSSPLSTTSTRVFSSNSPTIQRDINELEEAARTSSVFQQRFARVQPPVFQQQFARVQSAASPLLSSLSTKATPSYLANKLHDTAIYYMTLYNNVMANGEAIEEYRNLYGTLPQPILSKQAKPRRRKQDLLVEQADTISSSSLSLSPSTKRFKHSLAAEQAGTISSSLSLPAEQAGTISSSLSLPTKSKGRKQKPSTEKQSKSEYYNHVLARFQNMSDDIEIINEYKNYEAARKYFERKLRKYIEENRETLMSDAERIKYDKELKLLHTQDKMAKEGQSAASKFYKDQGLTDTELNKIPRRKNIQDTPAFRDPEEWSLKYTYNPDFTQSSSSTLSAPTSSSAGPFDSLSSPSVASLSQSSFFEQTESLPAIEAVAPPQVDKEANEELRAAIELSLKPKSEPKSGGYIHKYFHHCY